MDVAQVEQLVTPKTKAIIAVHIYGLPVDMDPLLEVARKYGIPVIEDAAESHGLLYKDRVAGSMGLVSTFSFYANKNITTGEGGMVLTDDEQLAIKIRSLRNLAFLPERRFVHEELGWNARMSSLQAALGTSQIKRLGMILDKRRYIGLQDRNAFNNLPNIILPLESTDYARNDYWVFGILLSKTHTRTAQEVMAQLEEVGIGTRPFFFPLHLQPLFVGDESDSASIALPTAELLGSNGFYIPNGLGMSEHQIDRVIESVLAVLT
jgi:perosamine synthetase